MHAYVKNRIHLHVFEFIRFLNCFQYVIFRNAVFDRECLHNANVEIGHVFEKNVEGCSVRIA